MWKRSMDFVSLDKPLKLAVSICDLTSQREHGNSVQSDVYFQINKKKIVEH